MSDFPAERGAKDSTVSFVSPATIEVVSPDSAVANGEGQPASPGIRTSPQLLSQKRVRKRRGKKSLRSAALPSADAGDTRELGSPGGDDDDVDVDALRDFLRSRPPIERLVQQNILRDGEDGQRRAAAVSELGRRLRDRPSAEQLLDKNVLKASDSSPAIAALRASISRQQHRDHLARSLRRKPALDELVRRNIYHRPPDEEEAAGVTAGTSSRSASLQLQAALLSELMRKRPPPGQVLKAELSKRIMMWTQMSDVGGVPPPPRNCHSWTLVGQRLFALGGFSQPPEPACAPLAALDLDVPEWQYPAACVGARMGLLPTPRYAHSAVPFADAFLVVFGGYGSGHWLNDVWLADVRPIAAPAGEGGGGSGSGSGWPNTVTWHFAAPGGPLPPPRAAHTAVVCEGCMVVFGGNDGSALFNDAWMLSLNESLLQWRGVSHVGTPPSPRSGHSSVLHGSEMLVFGGGEGWGGHCFNDLHSGHVDVVSHQIVWVRASFSGTPPSPRTGHSASLIADRMFVFGGGDARRALNDLHVLDLTGMAWSRPSDTGILPSPRGGHAAVAVGTFIAVFGGADPDGLGYNDLLLLDTEYSPYDAFDEAGGGAAAAVGGGSPADGLVPAGGATATAAAPSRGLVTQSDNESQLSPRVLPSRVVTAHALDPSRRSLSLWQQGGGRRRATSGAAPATPPAAVTPAPGADDLADPRNPMKMGPAAVAVPVAPGGPAPFSVAGGGAAPPPQAPSLKGLLRAQVEAHERADEEMFSNLLGRLERWRADRHAELEAMKALIERLA